MPDDKEKTPSGQHRPPGRLPFETSTTPKDLKVKLAEQRLSILWLDGARSDYSLDKLRGLCPCATCRTERNQEQDDNPLKVLKSDPSNVQVTSANLVGNYAIKFHWSDGHDTGIFDFRYLRSLE